MLGIGNILLRDDGLGVCAVDVMRLLRLPADVELADGGTAGADLVNLLAGRRKVVVVDAVEADDDPGTLFRLRPDDLGESEQPQLSLHQLGLSEALRMAALMGCAPAEVVVIGLTPKDLSPGLTLSAEVGRAMPRLVAAVLDELSL